MCVHLRQSESKSSSRSWLHPLNKQAVTFRGVSAALCRDVQNNPRGVHRGRVGEREEGVENLSRSLSTQRESKEEGEGDYLFFFFFFAFLFKVDLRSRTLKVK